MSELLDAAKPLIDTVKDSIPATLAITAIPCVTLIAVLALCLSLGARA